ncbi:DUF2809 domain-containing protein [Telluribacter sp.]|jgi:hypothetical protein|uniref:ribosomal maturation YjgA family protein n=1 Tax=Telluribacter sp. TaxID=1978767 RepID=UPI002E163232|nr:DUF2809 domain-containing protein [Telluribacter sp.]
MFTLDKKYLSFTIALFITEILIALYLNDRVIRPYGGDYLVVILVYCFIRALFRVSVSGAALLALLLAYLIEFLQSVNFVALLGLQNHGLAAVVLGHQFEWMDMLAYTLGIATVLVLEKVPINR